MFRLGSRCVGAIACAGSRRRFKFQSQFLTRHENESVQNYQIAVKRRANYVHTSIASGERTESIQVLTSHPSSYWDLVVPPDDKDNAYLVPSRLVPSRTLNSMSSPSTLIVAVTVIQCAVSANTVVKVVSLAAKLPHLARCRNGSIPFLSSHPFTAPESCLPAYLRPGLNWPRVSWGYATDLGIFYSATHHQKQPTHHHNRRTPE